MKLQAFFSASLLLFVFGINNEFKTNTSLNVKPILKVEAKPILETKEMSFAEFLSHFDKTELPFSITLEELNRKQSTSTASPQTLVLQKEMLNRPNPFYRSKFIPELSSNNGFSRIGPPQVEPIARFFPNDEMVAVVYKTFYSYRDGYKNYSLVIYDTKGNIVFPKKESKKIRHSGFSIGSFSTQNTVTCQIDEHGHIWKNIMTNIYDEDVEKHMYYKSDVVEYNLEETEVWKINDKGIIERLTEYPDLSRAFLD